MEKCLSAEYKKTGALILNTLPAPAMTELLKLSFSLPVLLQ